VDEREANTILATLDRWRRWPSQRTGTRRAPARRADGRRGGNGDAERAGERAGIYGSLDASSAAADVVPEQFMVMIECDDEAQQAELLQTLTDEGYRCRALVS